jgi:RNA polymerase sigma factor (sigma-70 family)
VKDCIQDLFLVLWKNRSTVNQTNFIKFYLLKSLRRKLNKALSWNIYSSINNELHFDAGFDDSVETKIILSENHLESSQKLRKLLATLSPRGQEVIFLRFYIDANYYQIAEIMSIHRQSAYNLLHDALRKLKKNFSCNKF